MKSKIKYFILALIMQFVIVNTANSQNLSEGKIWVTISDESLKPIDGQILTANNSFNQLLNTYNVTYYQPAFRNAKSKILKNTFELQFTGNTTEFYSQIETNFGKSFSFIKLHYEYPDVESYDPVDYMWQLTLQNPDSWLWHLKKIQADLAWDITKGDPNVTVAIIDADIDKDHPDLQTELLLDYDPYTNVEFTCNTYDTHGTTVSSFVSAETTETGNIANGQLASVGFNTKFIFYQAHYIDPSVYLQKAHHASLVMGADVITSSAGGWRCSVNTDPIEEAVVKEILDNGTVIVMPAGNGEGGTHCDPDNDGIHEPWYPLHPIYDERIIIVTGTDINDNHNTGTPGNEHSHSHFSDVDLCAPGWGTMGAVPTDCNTNTWPYYSPCNGTSFATPIVAGVCALLKSINKNLTPGEIQHILKTTTDPVTDGDDYIGLIGTGRVNAFKAVNEVVNCTPYVVETNETWNDDRTFICDVIVEPGVVLTINSNVYFGQSSSLIIKQSSKVILNNSTLTSVDMKKWQGIQVWGNINETQTEQYQGKIEMYNSTISNAHEAVQLWKPEDYSKTGGMIYSENSTFLNNRRAVSFLSFENLHPQFGIESDYSATFKRCTFENDENYLDDNPFHTFVSMWDVRGVKFKACKFDAGDFEQSGIYAIESGFKVESICNGAIGPDGCLPQQIERCEFHNFDKAISAQNTLAADLYPINIQHAYFYNNNYGVWAYYLDNVLTVKTSHFYIGKHGINKEKQICGSFFGRGINIQFSANFFIENNYFYPIPGGANSNDLIGIVAFENNGIILDIIKNNYFENLYIGNEAVGRNIHAEIGLGEGLKYECNDNTNNVIDFEVIDGPVWSGQIGYQLGSENLSAHNSYSNDNANIWHWRNMGDQAIDYYLHQNEYGTPYEPEDIKIETTNNSAYLFIKNDANEINDCYDGIGIHEERLVLTSTEQQELEMQFVIAENEYNIVEDIYNNMTDGGSTEITITNVENAQPDDTWEVRNELLGMSPFLSREVLEAAANKTDVLPNSILLDILASNPDELKKEDFIRFLENKDEPLPPYMISILRDVSNGATYKTALLNQMNFQKRKQNISAKKIINSLINDEEQNNFSIKSWLACLKNINADLQIASILIKEGNYFEANTLLDLIPNIYNLEGIELNLYQDDKYLLNLNGYLLQQGRNFNQLYESEINNLERIAENPYGMARASARVILENFYGYTDYCDCLNRNENKSSFREVKEWDTQKDAPLLITATPNPAKYYVEFYYELSEIDSEGEIVITDINGKVIRTFNVNQAKGVQAWDIQEITAGSYIYTLKTKYFEESGKLIIQ